MEIKNIKKEFLPELKELLNYCFGLDDEILERFVDDVYDPETCFGVFTEDNKLAASLSVIPYNIYFNEKTVGMGGISAVSTFPEYRNQSCAQKLLVKSLEFMKEKGDYFSFLNPFAYSFYRKYGWETGFEYKKYNMEIDHLRKFKDNNSCKFKKLKKENWTDIDRVYNSFVKKYNGPVKRSEKNWKIHLKNQEAKNKKRYGCIDDNGQLQGYIFFKIKEAKMSIDELAYTSIRYKKEILRFIYSHRAQIDKISWRPPGDDNTILMLSDPEREHELSLGMMWRIIDVSKVMESYTFENNLNRSFTIKVKDPYADWNNGVFRVEINQGKVKMLETDLSQGEISCSIQALSQLVSGYISLEERKALGDIEGRKEALDKFKKFIPDKNTYLNDYF